MRIKPGRSYPLGATYDGSGTNFSLFSEAAQRVELALIADNGEQECVDLTEMDGFVWHGYVPGVGPGPRYAFRVDGPYDLTRASAATRPSSSSTRTPRRSRARARGRVPVRLPLRRPRRANDTMDSRGHTMASVVTDPASTGATTASRTAYRHTVIYEVHVKGFTRAPRRAGGDPRHVRRLAHPAVIAYLSGSGSPRSSLPVHQSSRTRACSSAA